MCVALPDCICKQGSRLRSPNPSPLMKIRFSRPLPIVARGESGRARMPADQIRFAWPYPIVARGESGRAGMPADQIRFAWPLPIVARGESGRAGMPADHKRFACRFGPNHSPNAPVDAMSDAG